jgi:hypothetical protein
MVYGRRHTVCVLHIISQELEKGVLHGVLELVHFMTYFCRLVDFYSGKLIRIKVSANNLRHSRMWEFRLLEYW